MHLHSPSDVPFISEGDIKENVLYGITKELMISVSEIVNDQNVENVDIDVRRCRFPWETVGSYRLLISRIVGNFAFTKSLLF